MNSSIARPIVIATLISGTLDILFAMILTVLFGRQIPNMLRYVASGPFPDAVDMGTTGALLGLAVHFTLMAIMAAAFMLFVRRQPQWLDRPWLTAVGYGLVTYVVLDLIVVPLRFHSPLPPKTLSIVTQLFAHVVLVGFVMAAIARRTLRG